MDRSPCPKLVALRWRLNVADRGLDREPAGLGGQTGALDEIQESLEAAFGGGFVDPGSQAGPQYRNNLPHMRFIAQRHRRYGAEGRRLAVERDISEETAQSAGISRGLESERAQVNPSSGRRENDRAASRVAAQKVMSTRRTPCGSSPTS